MKSSEEKRKTLAGVIYEQAPNEFVEGFLGLEDGALEDMNDHSIQTDIEDTVNILQEEEVDRLLSEHTI